MSSILVRSRLRGVIKPGLSFPHERGPTKLARHAFTVIQTRLVRSTAQQQSQAGLARAPDAEYFSENIAQSLPQHVTQPAAIPEAILHHGQDILQKNSTNEVKEIAKAAFEPTTAETVVDTSNVPAYHHGSKFDRVPYWQNIERWKGVSEKQFLSYAWGVGSTYFLS